MGPEGDQPQAPQGPQTPDGQDAEEVNPCGYLEARGFKILERRDLYEARPPQEAPGVFGGAARGAKAAPAGLARLREARGVRTNPGRSDRDQKGGQRG